MRAARLFALFLALGLFGIDPIRPEGVLPLFDFVVSAEAGPLPAEQPAGERGTVPAKSAAAENALPAFVPEHHALMFSGESEAEPDGENLPPSQSLVATMLVVAADGVTSGSLAGAPGVAVAALGAERSATTGHFALASATSSPAEPDSVPAAMAAHNAPPAAPESEPKFVAAKALFGAVKSPAPLAARAIGYYARGCLSGGVALPIDGPAWQEMRLSRNRNWGHPKLIALIKRFAKEAQKLDGWPGLLVGDIAQPRGGPMLTGHASHQVGLDADIWLTPMPNRRLTAKEREDMQATSMLDDTGVAVNPKVFTDKQVALIKRAASYPAVERIFVHPAIKKALCQAPGTDRAWLGKVRPYYGHYYHFHIRIKCPPGFGGCKPQPPPKGDDGCGKEIDHWLARVIPAKTPPPPPVAGTKPKPPKPPVMLSELPNECRAVLASKPDPVTIPREALMTPQAVRKMLANAESAKAALANNAAAGPGSAATAATKAAIASPALRPHLRKAIAEKK